MSGSLINAWKTAVLINNTTIGGRRSQQQHGAIESPIQLRRNGLEEREILRRKLNIPRAAAQLGLYSGICCTVCKLRRNFSTLRKLRWFASPQVAPIRLESAAAPFYSLHFGQFGQAPPKQASADHNRTSIVNRFLRVSFFYSTIKQARLL